MVQRHSNEHEQRHRGKKAPRLFGRTHGPVHSPLVLQWGPWYGCRKVVSVSTRSLAFPLSHLSLVIWHVTHLTCVFRSSFWWNKVG